MKDNVKITVAIPFYNAEKYLMDAVDSVIEQTFIEWELLLVDDGSTDMSLEIAKKYAQHDKRIKVYCDKKNKGLAVRLNEISLLADTKYLARMDADDIMHPQRLQIQYQTLIENPDIDVLGTNAYVIDGENKVFGIKLKSENELIDVNHFIHPTIMAKTQWFINNPYCDQAIRIEDAELWYRTRKVSNFKVISQPLLFYREFGVSYYGKYIKVIPSLIFLNKKYPFDFFWIRVLFQSIVNIPIFYFFEKLNLLDLLMFRRNEIHFESHIDYKDYVDTVYK